MICFACLIQHQKQNKFRKGLLSGEVSPNFDAYSIEKKTGF